MSCYFIRYVDLYVGLDEEAVSRATLLAGREIRRAMTNRKTDCRDRRLSLMVTAKELQQVLFLNSVWPFQVLVPQVVRGFVGIQLTHL